MKFNRVIIDTQKTLGNLTFLRCNEKAVYSNGVKVEGQFTYEVYLLSDVEQGEVLIEKFPKKLEIPFGTPVELVGEVELNSSVSGSGDFRSVAHKLSVEDIRVKGQKHEQK